LRDDPAQAARSRRFIERECTADNPAFVNSVVLCELVWVLSRAYRVPRSQVSAILNRIFTIEQITIEHRELAWAAFRDYLDGADFADALIATINRSQGCENTVTFDRRAAGRPGFSLL
jgi:predicted nucleic-acid-binding protein